MTLQIVARDEPPTVNAFERLIYWDLAEKFGHRTITALLENRPPETPAFFARMAAHFALAAMGGPEPPETPDEDDTDPTGAEEEDTREQVPFEETAAYRDGLIDAGRGHLVRR